MKKQLFYLFTLVILFSQLASSQTNNSFESQRTLLLMHPTVGTISGMTELIEKGIFSLKNYTIKGIYFDKEAYDYSVSETYITENQLQIKLEKIEGDITERNLFGKNECSPQFLRLFNESQGVIFFGGPDIPPAIYGEKTNTLTVITDPYRHYFESSFLFNLLGGFQDSNFIPLLDKKPDYLIVGFCLGMQTMNVATGGTMIQDIPQEVYKLTNVEDILNLPSENLHRNYNSNIKDTPELFWGNIHPIKIIERSWLERQGIWKPTQYPGVVSSHHQAVEKTGKGLRIVATSMDGKIIESLDHTKFPNVYGFQFHPEASDIYSYSNSYQTIAEGEKTSLRSMIEKGNGYDFHLALWKKFAEILNNK